MRVVQTVFGTFHHFELARELRKRGHLEAIFSTFPWSRLQREGLPHDVVRSFPWFHTAEYLLSRYAPKLRGLRKPLAYANTTQFDEWTTRQIAAMQKNGKHVDALIGISGSSLKAGQLVQRNGGVFICDRGSTHQRFQHEIVAEEHKLWGLPAPEFDERLMLREETIYATADAITVPSTATVRSFVAMGVPQEKMHRIPYGVNLDRFKPTGTPPADSFQCLFAGSVSVRKGFPYLLEAFAKVNHPRKKLVVAGGMQPQMQSILSRFPTADVELLGAIPQSQLIDLMSSSHVLILPSIEEGLALVQAQAMACGCPVIASRNSGGEDLFDDGVEGFIVSIRSADALTARMQQLADDPALQKAMSAAALERVKRIGGWQQYGEAWEKLLLQLTGNAAVQS